MELCVEESHLEAVVVVLAGQLLSDDAQGVLVLGSVGRLKHQKVITSADQLIGKVSEIC